MRSWCADREAGDAFVRAAEFGLKAGNEHEYTHLFTQAAKSYKMDPASYTEAAKCYAAVITRQLNGNNFANAAKLSKELAEMHEENKKVEDAIEAYKAAAHYYENSDSAT